MKAAFLALVFASCGPLYDRSRASCITECDVALFGSADCEGFQASERRHFARLEPIFPDMCRRARGWHVGVVRGEFSDGGAFTDPWGRNVGGLTYCGTMLVQLAGDNWRASAHGHEFAHAVQCPWGDPDHRDWDKRGIIAAYETANADP